eukprot:COSAG02_NODE_2059_length_9974_cov_6.226532_5_plen_187_part_00
MSDQLACSSCDHVVELKRCTKSWAFSYSLDSSRSSELPRPDRRRGNGRRACQPGSSSPMSHKAGCGSASGSPAADTRDPGVEWHGYTAKGLACLRCKRTQHHATCHTCSCLVLFSKSSSIGEYPRNHNGCCMLCLRLQSNGSQGKVIWTHCQALESRSITLPAGQGHVTLIFIHSCRCKDSASSTH